MHLNLRGSLISNSGAGSTTTYHVLKMQTRRGRLTATPQRPY
jgi:hypothetical protein